MSARLIIDTYLQSIREFPFTDNVKEIQSLGITARELKTYMHKIPLHFGGEQLSLISTLEIAANSLYNWPIMLEYQNEGEFQEQKTSILRTVDDFKEGLDNIDRGILEEEYT